jgi:hypothetical protein
MGKKKAKSSGYVSKGIVGHPMKTKQRDPAARIMNQVQAWKKGKNVLLSIPSDKNPSIMEKVPALSIWGNPKPKQATADTEE